MAKLLLLILLAFVIAQVWRQARQRALDAERQKPQPGAPERIVACAHCGVHVPESEAVRDTGYVFCCAAHRDAWRAGR